LLPSRSWLMALPSTQRWADLPPAVPADAGCPPPDRPGAREPGTGARGRTGLARWRRRSSPPHPADAGCLPPHRPGSRDGPEWRHRAGPSLTRCPPAAWLNCRI